MAENLKKHMMVPYIGFLFVMLGLVLQPINDFLIGYKDILVSTSILLTDYVEVGGLGPALFNSGSLILISYFFIRKIKLNVSGPIFAGILIIGGFAFFGKNILNVSIVFLGVFLYSRYKRVNLKSVILVFLFATGLSPISSLIIFGLELPYYLSIPLGILAGVTAGFILVELSQRVVSFHSGYNLYNVGFASGIITLAFFSILKIIGVEVQTNLMYTNESHLILLILFVLVSLVYIIVGIILSKGQVKRYKDILSLSGRAVTDFTKRVGYDMTFINIGLTGLAALAILLLIGVQLNGPVMGGLLTITGFSAFGKHVKNAIPPMLGVALLTVLLGLDFDVTIILALIFSTSLAPITGDYGLLFGVLTGMLHLPLAKSIGQLHGGVLLYSNGFAAGFTAIIITTFISTFKRRDA